jgi:hypothetical protein
MSAYEIQGIGESAKRKNTTNYVHKNDCYDLLID